MIVQNTSCLFIVVQREVFQKSILITKKCIKSRVITLIFLKQQGCLPASLPALRSTSTRCMVEFLAQWRKLLSETQACCFEINLSAASCYSSSFQVSSILNHNIIVNLPTSMLIQTSDVYHENFSYCILSYSWCEYIAATIQVGHINGYMFAAL